MNTLEDLTIWAIILFLGIIWIKSGVEKIYSGRFTTSLEKTLEYFASKNPYLWYQKFLRNVAMPHSRLLGESIQWFELVAGIILVVGSTVFLNTHQMQILPFIFVALVISWLMNVSFWLACSWTSPAADTLNLLMVGMESIYIISIFAKLFFKG